MLIRFNGKRQFRQIDALSKATTSIIDPSFPTPLTFYKRRAGDETWDETAPNIATGRRVQVRDVPSDWLLAWNI